MYSTMVSKRVIAYLLVLTTMSIEISILFKIAKNAIAIENEICMLSVHVFFCIFILTFNIFIYG